MTAPEHEVMGSCGEDSDVLEEDGDFDGEDSEAKRDGRYVGSLEVIGELVVVLDGRDVVTG